MTLPNLNHATGDKERVTRVKKAFSGLTEAVDRAQAIYGPFDTWFEGLSTAAEKSERLGKRTTEFMKISKDCGLETDAGCVTSGQSNVPDGYYIGRVLYDSSDYYKVTSADGMSIIFIANVDDGYLKQIVVDIDGPNKGSFTEGKDLFAFQVDSENQLIPYNPPSDGIWSWSYIVYAKAFTSWILDFDNADYLKANSSGKCNDSDIVLDGTTNTSCH